MTTRLHIGNIPTTATDKDLEAIFRQFGLVDSVGISKDQITGLSEGCGFVVMCNESDAETAISRLNFSQYGGRTISVGRSRTARGSRR
jgi:RNA recognition motif-containing protein